MLTGKRFKLENPTLALDIVDGKRVAVTIPAGAIIRVVSGPIRDDEGSTLTAVWEKRTVTMFACDVNMRGTEIAEQGAKA